MNASFQINMDSLQEMLIRRGLERNGRVQRYIDNEVLRLSMPMIPFQVGDLQRSGQLGSQVGSGVITYNAPYARYHYYGKVMAGRAPKHVTGKKLKHHGSPLRGAFWFERMKAAYKKQILEGARREAGKGV